MTTYKGLVVIGVLVLVVVTGIVLASRTTVQRRATVIDNTATALKYLPLGDSYTIGQSVREADRWPNQLVAKLQTDAIPVRIVANPAVTGYTTQDLIDKELPLLQRYQPDIVTIQIGVNDYVQGVPAATFQKHLMTILDAVQRGLPQPGNIVLVTIPDYAKTPTGAQFGDPVAASAAIAQFNSIIQQAGANRGLPVADVYAVSQGVVSDPQLIANDGLHPSGKQYAMWTEAIYQALKASSILSKH